MANAELKNTLMGSTLRDAKHNLKDQMDEATPLVRETFGRVSDVASNIYGRASGWLKEGNNRNYGFIALAAATGMIGFFVGRGISRSNSSDM